jgi:hypothetical protein
VVGTSGGPSFTDYLASVNPGQTLTYRVFV